MKTLIFLLLFISKSVSAQVPIDWAVCIEENNYYYTNANIKDFKKINKRVKFCYNHNYFGFRYTTDNYIQIFPLESYNTGTDNSGNVTEGFCNGECPNYERGDITVEITHSKPQRIWINYSRQLSYAICIYTNSLYEEKIKSKKAPKPDTLFDDYTDRAPATVDIGDLQEFYTGKDSSKMCMVRITDPLYIDVVSREIGVKKELLNKWNVGYDSFVYSTHPASFYDFRIPKAKLDIFLQRRTAITKKSKAALAALQRSKN